MRAHRRGRGRSPDQSGCFIRSAAFTWPSDVSGEHAGPGGVCAGPALHFFSAQGAALLARTPQARQRMASWGSPVPAVLTAPALDPVAAARPCGPAPTGRAGSPSPLAARPLLACPSCLDDVGWVQGRATKSSHRGAQTMPLGGAPCSLGAPCSRGLHAWMDRARTHRLPCR